MSFLFSLATSAFRFGRSCLIMLGWWTAWLTLGGTLGGLVYITVAKELPVPDFVLRHIETKLASANLAIKFGQVSFDPTGQILFKDFSLRLRQFEEPLITSRLVYVRANLWAQLAGQSLPDEIHLINATLQLPAMLAPSGTTEPLVRDLTLKLRHEGRLWHIDLGAGRLGQLTVTAQGTLAPPAITPAGTPPTLEAMALRLLQLSRQLVPNIHRFDSFDDPTLTLRFDSPAGVGNRANILFTARAAHRPWDQPITLGSFAATTTLRLDGTGPRTLRVHAAIHHGAYQGDYTLEQIRAILTFQIALNKFSLQPTEALVAASTLTALGEQAQAPVLQANFARWPAVQMEVATQINGEFIRAEVSAQLQNQTALIQAEGRVAPTLISSILGAHTPRAASYFLFADPIAFRATASFGPHWNFSHLVGRFDAGRLDSHGVPITALRGQIDLHPTTLFVHDAQMELGENSAHGSYGMNFITSDYRMLLEGKLHPVAISGWFNSDWWSRFWTAHFDFYGPPPAAQVDVQGRWVDPNRTFYFGSTAVSHATIWGGDFEQADAVIFLRPHFTHGLRLKGTRAQGTQQLTGNFKRFSTPGSRETNRFEFLFDTQIDPATLGKMLDGKADEVIASLQLAQPPHLHAEGAIEGRWPGATPNYTFRGQASGGLHYYGFPLETARVKGGVTGTEVRLDEIEFTTAGGHGAGKAALYRSGETRRLGFDLNVNGTDLARAIRAGEEYQANRRGQKIANATESKFIQRASGGRLDVALSAEGQPGDLASFTGTGNASITGIELGEIQLFGLLSQVLSGLSLKFSSLKLEAARTSFKLDNGRLHFPDLKISGPSAIIDGHGDFILANDALNFTAKFKPFAESDNPLTAIIGIVINPITSILELKLGGILTEPHWSVIVGPADAPVPVAPKGLIEPGVPTPIPPSR
jgi:hypothetical protein